MKKFSYARFLALLFPILACGLFTGQEPGQWRFWTIAQHMAESYARTVTVDSAGKVWIRHGTVGSMSGLDGYSVWTIPEPRVLDGLATTHTFWFKGRVYGSNGQKLWTVDLRSLKHYDGHRWI